MAVDTNYEELTRTLISEFNETRENARHSIDRLRRVVDAIITCRPDKMQIQSEDLSVRDLVNDLKTVERYVSKEAKRMEATRAWKQR